MIFGSIASPPAACQSPASARLQQRFLEGAANRHHSPRFHLRPRFSSPWNFSNCHFGSSPPRSPASAQTCRSLLRDVVCDLVQRVATQAARNLRNRKPVAFEAAPRARHARIHLDHNLRRSPDSLRTVHSIRRSQRRSRAITLIAPSLMRWYSRSLSVCAGATVIESPVCTPIGSKFQSSTRMIRLSARSRITSSHIPSSPAALFNQNFMYRDRSNPRARDPAIPRIERNPPPEPPSVNDGRSTTGKPASSRSPARPSDCSPAPNAERPTRSVSSHP